jgi:hypothetical protein
MNPNLSNAVDEKEKDLRRTMIECEFEDNDILDWINMSW